MGAGVRAREKTGKRTGAAGQTRDTVTGDVVESGEGARDDRDGRSPRASREPGALRLRPSRPSIAAEPDFFQKCRALLRAQIVGDAAQEIAATLRFARRPLVTIGAMGPMYTASRAVI